MDDGTDDLSRLEMVERLEGQLIEVLQRNVETLVSEERRLRRSLRKMRDRVECLLSTEQTLLGEIHEWNRQHPGQELIPDDVPALLTLMDTRHKLSTLIQQADKTPLANKSAE
jgi:hypothetical protein